MSHPGASTGRFEGLAAPDRLAGAPRIWAVGGGKGGVGKSLVASSLACAMAARGRSCTLIDADLGGANLHTLLGVSHPRRTLSHFLSGEVKALADLLVPTRVPNLSLVSANKALLEMANPKHTQKEKLFRHVRGLDVDEVILDVGGGSAFNVLDAFLVARRGLVIVTPEPTAIENAEHFLRAGFYRSLRTVTRKPEVKASILRVKERAPRIRSARELIAEVRRFDPSAAKLLAERAQAFMPLLLVNQAASLEDRSAGPSLAERCRNRLGVAIDYAGHLDADPNVRESVARRRPPLELFSRCAFSRQIEAIAERLLDEQWEAPEGSGHAPRPAPPSRPRVQLSPPADPAPPADGETLPPIDLDAPGESLRRRRRRLGLTLRELTERTRIQGLGDIERERFAKLPPEPYLRGFLLSYARELGIEEIEALTSSYLERHRRALGDEPTASERRGGRGLELRQQRRRRR